MVVSMKCAGQVALVVEMDGQVGMANMVVCMKCAGQVALVAEMDGLFIEHCCTARFGSQLALQLLNHWSGGTGTFVPGTSQALDLDVQVLLPVKGANKWHCLDYSMLGQRKGAKKWGKEKGQRSGAKKRGKEDYSVLQVAISKG